MQLRHLVRWLPTIVVIFVILNRFFVVVMIPFL